jgi:hypothetical protein
MGEVGENAPNEANCDETMSMVEAQEPIQVTANSGAVAGLDKEDCAPRFLQGPPGHRCDPVGSELPVVRRQPNGVDDAETKGLRA